ncbi:hypothetical protein NPIL_456851 [Nephila pilipes]|uniref:Uncharacterized protein n=1 Tax=Nephila pilipes TaxID=299642 RepID=A0A8X6QHF0_NEPPI|nr:hypothetical protein NPIL_456851 [Nephila pilipes]
MSKCVPGNFILFRNYSRHTKFRSVDRLESGRMEATNEASYSVHHFSHLLRREVESIILPLRTKKFNVPTDNPNVSKSPTLLGGCFTSLAAPFPERDATLGKSLSLSAPSYLSAHHSMKN